MIETTTTNRRSKLTAKQARWRDRKKHAGLVAVATWVPAEDKERLLKYAERLRKQYKQKKE